VRLRAAARAASVAGPSGGRASIRPVLLAIALVCAVVAYAWLVPESGFPTWLRLRAEVADAEARIHTLEQENGSLREEVTALSRDRFAQERAVRETLGWARPGEIVVRAPDARDGERAIP
jgi:cell division protein FtsB